MTVGFRLARWSSHIREHGIQIEKTFAMLGYAPTEPARLVRNLLAAYGRAESVAFGRLGVEGAADRVAGRSDRGAAGDPGGARGGGRGLAEADRKRDVGRPYADHDRPAEHRNLREADRLELPDQAATPTLRAADVAT